VREAHRCRNSEKRAKARIDLYFALDALDAHREQGGAGRDEQAERRPCDGCTHRGKSSADNRLVYCHHIEVDRPVLAAVGCCDWQPAERAAKGEGDETRI
jgi:hypothetical protein